MKCIIQKYYLILTSNLYLHFIDIQRYYQQFIVFYTGEIRDKRCEVIIMIYFIKLCVQIHIFIQIWSNHQENVNHTMVHINIKFLFIFFEIKYKWLGTNQFRKHTYITYVIITIYFYKISLKNTNNIFGIYEIITVPLYMYNKVCSLQK